MSQTPSRFVYKELTTLSKLPYIRFIFDSKRTDINRSKKENLGWESSRDEVGCKPKSLASLIDEWTIENERKREERVRHMIDIWKLVSYMIV